MLHHLLQSGNLPSSLFHRQHPLLLDARGSCRGRFTAVLGHTCIASFSYEYASITFRAFLDSTFHPLSFYIRKTGFPSDVPLTPLTSALCRLTYRALALPRPAPAPHPHDLECRLGELREICDWSMDAEQIRRKLHKRVVPASLRGVRVPTPVPIATECAALR